MRRAPSRKVAKYNRQSHIPPFALLSSRNASLDSLRDTQKNAEVWTTIDKPLRFPTLLVQENLPPPLLTSFFVRPQNAPLTVDLASSLGQGSCPPQARFLPVSVGFGCNPVEERRTSLSEEEGGRRWPPS